MGLTLLQGYGQTEAAPVISCNRPRAGLKMDTVGPPLRGVEVKIAEDGEILVRGELVMHGYWRNDAETARALQDGWLHTGDIGHLDAGRIVITDRKKDMIVNDKGDNVSPQKGRRHAHAPARNRAGDGGATSGPTWSADRARRRMGAGMGQGQGRGFDLWRLAGPAEPSAARARAVDRVNRDLSVIEKVRQFAFADEPFTIENEEMTPKQSRSAATSSRSAGPKARLTGERLDGSPPRADPAYRGSPTPRWASS
jgi:long-chain acyl-CoA synthetase